MMAYRINLRLKLLKNIADVMEAVRKRYCCRDRYGVGSDPPESNASKLLPFSVCFSEQQILCPKLPGNKQTDAGRISIIFQSNGNEFLHPTTPEPSVAVNLKMSKNWQRCNWIF
jgi:hypothetical protein